MGREGASCTGVCVCVCVCVCVWAHVHVCDTAHLILPFRGKQTIMHRLLLTDMWGTRHLIEIIFLWVYTIRHGKYIVSFSNLRRQTG